MASRNYNQNYNSTQNKQNYNQNKQNYNQNKQNYNQNKQNYNQTKQNYNQNNISNQNDDENQVKIMTGFINISPDENLSPLFEILNKFRNSRGLKYSHQYKVNKIFFNISSEYLDEFYNERQFQISKYQTRSEFYCDPDIAQKLLEQKDSFLRMKWDQNNDRVLFLSRTPYIVHLNLVRRIFKDSNIEFIKDDPNYCVLTKPKFNFYGNNHNQDDQDDQDD